MINILSKLFRTALEILNLIKSNKIIQIVKCIESYVIFISNIHGNLKRKSFMKYKVFFQC